MPAAKALAHRMRIVRTPDPRRCHLINANVAPALTGAGIQDYACGSCGTVLLASVTHDLVQDAAVRCATCGLYNDLPPARRGR